ncbi:MAG: sn-glycerol-3-phosphate ABC transporter ATP-binding protein UgpC [Burkholderiales bacterium]|jgi:multiple sugar transport system ATP-binding protein
MSTLSIRNVKKRYGPVEVLKGIDIEVTDGEFLILVGPSGCGKSTLLNMIAGLDTISSGEIAIGGRVVNDLSPKDRDIAMVFQSYALYPNMTVRNNISFGLKIRKIPKQQQEETVNRVAKLLQIEALLDRMPSQLSGGQRQRVAMGRALARDPALFLFDEPLSNLDAKLRVEMRAEIKLLHERLGTTIVYVTHDQIEAMTLGDRIAVMKAGEVHQLAAPQEVYDDPVDLFVAGFIGSPPMNLIRATVVRHDNAIGVELHNRAGAFFLKAPASVQDGLAKWEGKEVILGIRPEQITDGVSSARAHPEMVKHSARIDVVHPTGPDTLILIELNSSPVTCRIHPETVVRAGETAQLMFDLSKLVFFDPEKETRIR